MSLSFNVVGDCAYNAGMNYKQYGGVLLVLIFIVVLVVLPGLLKQPSLRSSEDKPREYYYSNCRVSEGCLLGFEDGSVNLVIKPYTMPVLQPLQVNVLVDGAKPVSVNLEFVGRDMPMGLMPYHLSLQQGSVDQHPVDQWHFEGSAMITLCPADRNMIWLAKVVVEFDQLTKIMVFELENK
ncbi:hypothetical protein [Endozoicomonas euniceicola]|uniref:Uncharacterized protein n=1 Tax=Endozoicomonas euniceicola TaxID=1234143 RepID=A0ABY6GT66_9GAMM|nr:hypothetical protein [Endozoicomonas euniceicola]UYM15256.1 hypothetical protein NX720_20735 [Endozoicomonas euniceicola]